MNKHIKQSVRLYYLDALAGAGKTHAFRKELNRRVMSGALVLVVQPTKFLIKETCARLAEDFPELKVSQFYGTDEQPDGIVARICAHLKSDGHDPHVVFITWSAFLRLDFIGPVRWDLMIDEIPQVHERIDLELEAAAEIHSHLDNTLSGIAGYMHVHDKIGDGYLGQLLKVKRSKETYDQCYELLWRLKSSHWHVFTADKGAINTTFYALLEPTIFGRFTSAVIAGANFKRSFLCRYWTLKGVVFGEPEWMRKGLRYDRHMNGPFLTIYYAIESDWSKHRRGPDGDLLKQIALAALDVFGEQQFAWKANKDAEKTLAELFDGHNALKIPQSPHGRNDFDSVHCVMDLSASNPTPDYGKFLETAMQWTRNEVRQAMHREIVYQTVMRGSLRDPSNTDRMIVVVPDLPMARYLASYFDGCAICPLRGQFPCDSKPVGRPKMHDSAKDRTRISRALDAESVKTALMRYNEFTKDEKLPTHDSCNEITYNTWNKRQQFLGSLCHFQKSSETLALSLNSVSAFIAFLKSMHKEQHESKNATILISPAKFETSNGRKRIDVEFANGIFIDVDDGDMHPDDFARIMEGVKCVVYNTFSSRGDQLRYRVWIPTDRIMVTEAYYAIIHTIIEKVAEGGFSSEKRVAGQNIKISGIEHKYGPEQLFRLPCQPKDKSGRFWKVYPGKPLNVGEWLSEAVAILASYDGDGYDDAISPLQDGHVDEARVQRARAKWRELAGEDGGNERFLILGTNLAKTGMCEAEIRFTLEEEAPFRNPRKRLAQIPSILNTLRSEGWIRN